MAAPPWTPWAVLAGAAVLVFWMVGAYNRLVALRNAIGDAWAAIDAARARRAEAVPPLLAALQVPLAGEQGARDSFVAAHQQSVTAAERMSAGPVSAAAAAAWARAESTLASASARLLALAAQQPQWHEDPALAEHAAAWNEAGKRIRFARGVYDGAVAAYNAALAQAPTRWLRRVFGFEPAGLLG